EAGEIHQVDVLHVGAFAQVLDQAPERGGLQLGAGLVIHYLPHSKVWVSAINWSTTMRSAGSRSIPSSIARRYSATWRWAEVPRARMVRACRSSLAQPKNWASGVTRSMISSINPDTGAISPLPKSTSPSSMP